MNTPLQHQVRVLTFEVEGRAADGRIPVVVSSDAPIFMGDIQGPEVLVHTPEAVDLTRAPLPIIVTHVRRHEQVAVGVVEDLAIGGGRMRGWARFGERPEAKEYERDVLNGTIRSVSVGYARVKSRFRRADGVLLTERWLPTHAAIVAEPADTNAGFFRSLELPAFELQPDITEPAATAAQPGATTMADPAAGNPADPQLPQDPAVRGLSPQPRQGPGAVEMEAERRTAIENLCKAGSIDEGIRSFWITSGAPLSQVSNDYLQIVADRAKDGPKITQLGLSDKEAKRYSLSRAIEACASGNWSGAGYEAEASRTIQQRLNRIPDPKRFFIPWEVQERANMSPSEAMTYQLMNRLMARDLSVASAANGGYLKETVNVGFIELLRNKSVLMSMGALRLSGLQGDVTIPKQSATGSATWLASESSTISEINQTFTQIALSPKTVGGYTEISRQLLLQSNPYVEGLVMNDLATVVALDIDAKGLNGSGASGQPTGILNTAGIGSVTGTSMDYADIVEFQTDVFAGNALTGNSGYVTTGAIAGLLKGRVKFTSTASPIWDGRLDSANVDGYRGMASNQMPSATMLFGDFGLGVVIAEWGVLEVEVNPYANFQAGIIGVRAIASVDIGVRYATAFSAASSIT